MSQISMLGFVPSHTPTEDANAFHWAVLLSPDGTSTPSISRSPTQQKAKSFFSSRRNLSRRSSNDDSPSPSSTLFDMHSHQLRQQTYPITIQHSNQTTTSILSSDSSDALSLSIRINLAIHSLSVAKLTPKISALLYRTPTYGTSEDWFRAAVSLLALNDVLSPPQNYDADALLQYTSHSIHEYFSLIATGARSEREVLDLNYAAHLQSMDNVRDLLRQKSQSPRRRPSPPSSRASLMHSTGGATTKKQHKFWGFTVSPSPSWNSGQGQQGMWVASSGGGGADLAGRYGRGSDPYGGLM
jgi:hypothetical protein